MPEIRLVLTEATDILLSNDIERARRWVAGFGVWGPVLVLLCMVLQTLIPVIPSIGLMVVSTLAYGPLWGGVLAWIGLMIAAAVGYAMGRFLGPTAIRLAGEKNMRVVDDLMNRYGIWAVVAARISPLISTDAVSLAAGLGHLKFVPFMLATAVGTLPLTVLIAVLAEDFGRIATGLTVTSVLSLLGLAGYVWWDRRRGISKGA